ncbi:MAG: murein biosynthesis integral membrane protein MurJ [Candidatus Aminicenantes bacterium]|nr:murein biosynthesis integral membrane protein MurJ [Candidatus Aminicenantes bacterium]
MEKMKVVFTGGGTGGHVYPNIAIYEAIREKYPDASFLYIGSKKGAESRIIKNIPQPIEIVEVLSKGIPQNIKSIKTLVALFYIFLGTVKSYFVLKKFKPDIIIGSGGYVAAPVLFAASLLKLKVFIHEQNAVPGRLNRIIARFASRIGVSFSSTANFFPEDKVTVTGYPLRRSIRYNKEENIKEKFKIPEKNKVVFIFGGSGGARTINNAVAEIIPMLLTIEGLTVILATGRGYSDEYRAFEDTIKICEEIGIPADVEGKLIVREYFDNIDEIYSITDLVVSRAGAGTIKEITTLGIPSILIPKINLPGDHQILNAREVEKIGGAKIVYEAVAIRDNKQTIYVSELNLLKTIKDTLFDGDSLFNMRKNLRQVEKQNSTELILKEVEQLVIGKEKSEETQIKVFYLQPREGEKNIELIFDSTTVGNSYLCDTFVEGLDENVLIELKILNKQEKIIVRGLKGTVFVDGQQVEKWAEIKEDSLLEMGKGETNKAFVLKSYFEKVQKVHLEKSTTSKVLGSSFGIMFSRFGGLFRNVFVAAYFGASRATDIFAIGLTIANLMRRIVAENAMENAFLPIFSRLFHRTSRKKTWEAASSIVNFTLLLSLVLTIFLVIFTPVIIKSLFPAFETRVSAEAINLTRLIMPYLFLITLAAVMGTYLKAFNRFGIAEASAVAYSVGVIIGIVVFYSSFGIYSLAFGVLLGGVLHVFFLFPFVFRIFKIKSLRFSYKPVINFASPFNKKYYSQLGPISLDVIFSKVAEVVGKVLAGFLKEGAIAFLHFSLIIFQLPFAVVSQAINSVVLKEFSEQIALFDKKRARQLFLDGIKTNIFLLIPLSVLMIVLARPIVAILFQRLHFSPENTVNTAYALQFYALGLVGWGIHSLTVRIFAARIDIKTSMILNFFMLLVNVGLSFYLVNTPLTYAGLALATSLSFMLFAAIRVIILKIKLEKEEISIKLVEILSSLSKTLVSTALMLIVLIEARYVFQKIDFSSKMVGNLFLLISLTFIGASVYLLTSLILKNTELLIFKKKILRKDIVVPVSMLSPFRFLEKAAKNSDVFKDDYLYKVNIYLSSAGWEIRNIGIKLIGLFKDASKVDYLVDLLRSKKENGFIRRNAVNALKVFNIWNPDVKEVMMELLADSYYEVRAAAIDYLAKSCPARDYHDFKDAIHKRLKSRKTSIEEQLACLRLMAKMGDKEEMGILEEFFVSSNSLVREELLELLYNFYRRKILSAEELQEFTGKILITSNNLNPEFKLKSIIRKIYKEIE